MQQIGSSLQGPSRAPLNKHRLRIIRLSILNAFRDPSDQSLQTSLPFGIFLDRVNAYLWLKYRQNKGVTSDHLAYQLRWFCNRGMMTLDVSKVDVKNVKPDSIDRVNLNINVIDVYFGKGATPESIIDRIESESNGS